ncbi:MAG: cadherin repeat domain-containing protein, partial [Methanosarcinales archaeon]|nr:cadherin repeat domain-containing protein [Methanosarcinales archaeon]
EIGTSFSYTVNADDASAVTYSINDTANFNINPSTGEITNVTILSVGGYGLNITATDASMNSVSQIVTVTVQDTGAPVINSVVLNTTNPNAGEDILVTVNATDAGGVISVGANGVSLTDQGSNMWSGIITAIAGTHSVNVSATDGAANIIWDNSTSYSTSGLTGTISGKVTK